MSILWCGGEDIDFPNGGAISVNPFNSSYRSSYCRAAISASGSGVYARSNAFPGGAITSCWLRFYMNGTSNTAQQNLGLIKDATSNAGLWIGTAAASGSTIAISKYDGATRTQLAAESGTSVGSGNNRIDVQLVNYGASATITVYVNGTSVINYSGDPRPAGVTSLSAVGISGAATGGGCVSEIIVSDVDTRALQGLATLALTGAGTANNWTSPTYTNINGVSLSDANPTYTNTTGQDNEYNVTDLPTGTFSVDAVKISMRAAVSSSPTATQIKMGYNSGGSLGFGTGATKTLTPTYATYEQLDTTNPVTSSAWDQSIMNALQLDFQSA